MKIRLGTRGSQLALYQANTVAALLREAAGTDCEIVVIKTSGDRLSEAPLSEVGGKRLFVKEIEDALLSGEVDAGVHSSKDLPAVLPDGLVLGAVLPREDPRDVLILPADAGKATIGQIEDVTTVLGQSPRIGTSSVRRVAQLSRLWPGANFAPVRGNLDTRLRKLDAGEYHALVLAAAGINRLGFSARISLAIPVEACVPAPGQGAIAVEVRHDDQRALDAVGRITDTASAAALEAERTLVDRLGGGCQIPLGALGEVRDDDLHLHAIVTSLDGRRALRARQQGRRAAAIDVGERAAEQLIAAGAKEILDEVRRVRAPVDGLQP